MTMAEKIIAQNLVGQKPGQCVKPHDPVIAQGEVTHTNLPLLRFTHSSPKNTDQSITQTLANCGVRRPLIIRTPQP